MSGVEQGSSSSPPELAGATTLFGFQIFAPNRSLLFRISFIVMSVMFLLWKLIQVVRYTFERIQTLRRRRKRLARSSWALATAKKSSGGKNIDPPKNGIYQHRVAFLHPDLGIGGAERLIVDAVVGLQELIPTDAYLSTSSTLQAGISRRVVDTVDEEGIISTPDPTVCEVRAATTTSSPSQKVVLPALYDVHVFTNHHDPKRCFEETIDGSFRNPVTTVGSWIPRHIRNKGHVLFASLRMAYAAVVICFKYQLYVEKAFDCIVIDQAAAAMPIFKLLAPSTPLFFYCHFPDQLCDPSRMPSMSAATSVSGQLVPTITCIPHKNPLKRLYRGVFDSIEGLSMKSADRVVCNSLFSRGVTVQVFPSLDARISKTRDILYPPINLPQLLAGKGSVSKDAVCDNHLASLTELELVNKYLTQGGPNHPKFCAVSLNRYEQKKNIPLAIKAFGAYIRDVRSNPTFNANDYSLIIAGGYDPRLPENVIHYTELLKLVKNDFGDALRCATVMMGSSGDLPAEYEDSDTDKVEVLFLRSCTTNAKKLLLTYASAVVYTPSGEHFGIVPVEAMAFGAPVIAIANGGPLESVGMGDTNGLLRTGEVSEFKKALTLLWGKEGLVGKVFDKEDDNAAAVRSHLTMKGREIASNGASRASKTFSLDAFSTKMGDALDYLCDSKE